MKKRNWYTILLLVSLLLAAGWKMDMRVQKWQHDRNTVDEAENTVDEFSPQTTKENITSRRDNRGIFKLYIFIPLFTLFFGGIYGMPCKMEKPGVVCRQPCILLLRSKKDSDVSDFISYIFASQLVSGCLDGPGSR